MAERLDLTRARAIELRGEMPKRADMAISTADKRGVWFVAGVRGKEMGVEQAIALSQAPSVIDYWRGECERLEAERYSAKRLCQVYWTIAVNATGQDKVRAQRDAMIAEMEMPRG